jgi:hypothetical protein
VGNAHKKDTEGANPTSLGIRALPNSGLARSGSGAEQTNSALQLLQRLISRTFTVKKK